MLAIPFGTLPSLYNQMWHLFLMFRFFYILFLYGWVWIAMFQRSPIIEFYIHQWDSRCEMISTLSMSSHKVKRCEHQLKIYENTNFEHAMNLCVHFFFCRSAGNQYCAEDAQCLWLTPILFVSFHFLRNIFSRNSVSNVVLWWFIENGQMQYNLRNWHEWIE